ncbi:hypothetical protein JYP52_21525 [Nitratireductor aquibiodomus]|uniref:hypothetical protein n=1 Tax=Nitratireductor TaxID=245876 RepID=UPI000DDCC777|nr:MULTISPECIES: hypothetical protein [Nitratireductor]MBN7763723.1 hypothetical protein [Nitratireductor aquibiodomus]
MRKTFGRKREIKCTRDFDRRKAQAVMPKSEREDNDNWNGGRGSKKAFDLPSQPVDQTARKVRVEGLVFYVMMALFLGVVIYSGWTVGAQLFTPVIEALQTIGG